MKQNETTKRTLEYPENYEFKQISGAFGGFAHNGKFYINFVNDVPGTPEFEMVEVLEDGKSNITFGPEESFNILRRKVVAGFVLDQEFLLSLYKWLEKSITESNIYPINTTENHKDDK